MTAYVYNPDDEDDLQTFGGKVYLLPANHSAEIVSSQEGVSDDYVADFIVEKLGAWGVCRVNGPVAGGRAVLPEDQPTVDAAELKYLEATKAWAESAIVEDQKIRKPYSEAGLYGPRESHDAQAARRWLKDYDKKLRAAKIIT